MLLPLVFAEYWRFSMRFSGNQPGSIGKNIMSFFKLTHPKPEVSGFPPL